jgi:hypothetical protein
VQIRGEIVWGQNKCGRASHPTASFVDSCFCLVTAWRRNDRFSPAALPLSRTKKRSRGQSELPTRHLAMTTVQPLRRPAALVSCSLFVASAPKSKGSKSNEQEGEAATPGQPVALARVSDLSPGNSPSRIAGCRWLCRNHPASTGTLTFRCTHSHPLRCAPQPKKLLPLCRNCGRCVFPVEARGKLEANCGRERSGSPQPKS